VASRRLVIAVITPSDDDWSEGVTITTLLEDPLLLAVHRGTG
jgi:hypothetical protein